MASDKSFKKVAAQSSLRGQEKRKYLVSGKRVSLRALAYIMAGHVRHHLGILRDRYGVSAG